MKKRFLYLLALSLSYSCSMYNKSQIQGTRMKINHFQSIAMGVVPVLTLLVQEGDAIGTKNWNNFYSPIEGFTFEPGFIYDILVKVEKIENPPEDTSALKYTLIKIKSKEKVTADILFDMHLKIGGENLLTTTPSGLALLNQINIDCNTICDVLNTKLQQDFIVIGTFKRQGKNDLQLVKIK